jgi:TonB family protein
MNNIVSQSLFHTATVQVTWRSKVTSIAVHAILLGLAFAITFPVIQEQRNQTEHVTLIAPVIPEYKPKIQAPRHVETAHFKASPVIVKPLVAKIPEPKPVIPPPPAQRTILPEAPAVAKAEVPAAPKPVKSVEVAKVAPIVPKVIVGGFGDPRAVHEAENSRPAPVMMAKVGAFESPEGSGQSGAAGRSAAGLVKQTAFGNVDGSTAAVGGRGQSTVVRTGNFGEGVTNGTAVTTTRGNTGVRSSGFGDTIAPAAPPKLVQTAAAAFTPVEILYKPRPAYSPEARNMRVEGQVSLEVVFQASGAVKVVRVIRGLGHGLDEAAQQAALQVKFKPAMRSGVAIDQTATISITFELS